MLNNFLNNAKRAISLVLIVCFTFTNIALPKSEASDKENNPSWDQFDQIGRIEKTFKGSSPYEVFYIQDAHASLEAQKNIAQLITYLTDQKGITEVLTEGFEGPSHLGDLFGEVKPELKDKTSYFFMDYLRLSGTQYAYLNRDANFRLTGIEKHQDYLDILTAYREGAENRDAISKDLNEISRYLNALGDRVYPKEIKEFIKLRMWFENKQMSLGDYVFRLMKLTGKAHSAESIAKNAMPLYPHLAIVSQYLNKLNLTVEESRELNAKLKAIDHKIFFKELQALEQEIVQTDLKEPVAKQTYDYQGKLELLKKLNAFSLTPEEYQELQLAASNSQLGNKLLTANCELLPFTTQSIAQFLAINLKKPVLLSNRWESLIEPQIRFYDLARKREENFKKNLSAICELALSRVEGLRTAPLILVTGGFHKEALTKFFEDKGISYTVISPKITGEDPIHQQRYDYLMSGGYYGFETPLLRPSVAAAQQATLEVLPRQDVERLIKTVIRLIKIGWQVTRQNVLKDIAVDASQAALSASGKTEIGEAVMAGSLGRKGEEKVEAKAEAKVEEMKVKAVKDRNVWLPVFCAVFIGLGVFAVKPFIFPKLDDSTVSSSFREVDYGYQLNEGGMETLRDPDPLARKIELINFMGDRSPASIQARIDLLDDPDWQVRADTITSMERPQELREFEALRRVLAKDPEPVVRSLAILALQDDESKETRDLLTNLLTDSNPYARFFAANGLKATGNEEAVRIWNAENTSAGVKRFSADLEKIDQPYIRRLAILALIRLQNPEARNALLAYLHDPSRWGNEEDGDHFEALLETAMVFNNENDPYAFLVLMWATERHGVTNSRRKIIYEMFKDKISRGIHPADIEPRMFEDVLEANRTYNARDIIQSYVWTHAQTHKVWGTGTWREAKNLKLAIHNRFGLDSSTKQYIRNFLGQKNDLQDIVKTNLDLSFGMTLFSLLVCFLLFPPLLITALYSLAMNLRARTVVDTPVSAMSVATKTVEDTVRFFDPRGHWSHWLVVNSLFALVFAIPLLGFLEVFALEAIMPIFALSYVLAASFYHLSYGKMMLTKGEEALQRILLSPPSYDMLDVIAVLEDPDLVKRLEEKDGDDEKKIGLNDTQKEKLLNVIMTSIPYIRIKTLPFSKQTYLSRAAELRAELQRLLAKKAGKAEVAAESEVQVHSQKEPAEEQKLPLKGDRAVGTIIPGKSLGQESAFMAVATEPTFDDIVANLDFIAQHNKPVSLVLDYGDFSKSFTEQEREAVRKHFLAGHIKVILTGTEELRDVFASSNLAKSCKVLDKETVSKLSGFLGKGKILHLSKGLETPQPVKEKLGNIGERFIFLKEIPELKAGEILTLGIFHASAEYFTNPEYYRDALIPSQSGFWIPNSLKSYLLELSRQYLSAQSLGQAA